MEIENERRKRKEGGNKLHDGYDEETNGVDYSYNSSNIKYSDGQDFSSEKENQQSKIHSLKKLPKKFLRSKQNDKEKNTKIVY